MFVALYIIFPSPIVLLMKVAGPPERYYHLIIAQAGKLSQEDNILPSELIQGASCQKERVFFLIIIAAKLEAQGASWEM